MAVDACTASTVDRVHCSTMAATRPFLVRHLIEESTFELELVAGAAGVDRECRGVSIGEHLDPTPWMARGSIHLTAGLALADRGDPAEGARLLRRLDAAGMVGLGVSIPHYLSTIPRPMRDEADRLGLPLFAVTGNTLFRDIEQYVYDMLASDEMHRLRRGLSAQQQLLELTAGEDAPAGIVARLAVLLDAIVLLVDGEGGPVASAGPAGGRDAGAAFVAPAWSAYRAGDRDRLPRPELALDGRRMLWRDVVVDGRLRMVLMALFEQARPHDEFAGTTLTYAQRLLEVEARRHLAPGGAPGAPLLRELLSSPRAAVRCVERLALGGIAEDAAFRVVVIEPRTGAGEGEAALRGSVSALNARGLRYLVMPVPGGVVALVSPGRDAGIGAELADELVAALAAEGEPCLVGLSEECRDLGRASSLYSHALQALAAGRAPRSGRDAAGAMLYEQLGPRRAALDALDDAILAGLAERCLAPLRAADRGGASRLVDSLACYLRHDCRVGDAAVELAVHRNTLCKRLARVERTLGVDLGAVGDLVDVRLAFEADAILRGRRAAVVQ
jgi:PucR family transcriptional regulator, purine catabolism regulatory protein